MEKSLLEYHSNNYYTQEPLKNSKLVGKSSRQYLYKVSSSKKFIIFCEDFSIYPPLVETHDRRNWSLIAL